MGLVPTAGTRDQGPFQELGVFPQQDLAKFSSGVGFDFFKKIFIIMKKVPDWEIVLFNGQRLLGVGTAVLKNSHWL